MHTRITLALFLLAAVAVPTRADTVFVSTLADAGSGDTSSIAALIADPGPDGLISLREAITAANNTPGADEIRFDPALVAGTILLGTPLPEITDPVTIDGASAGIPAIQLDGIDMSFDGLVVSAGSSTIVGLVLNRFQTAILLREGGGNLVARCHIGVDFNGTAAIGNKLGGIRIESANNRIGTGQGVGSGGNVISGNDQGDGIRLFQTMATGNRIEGNHIGTDVTGTMALPNFSGIRILYAPNNAIGGTLPEQRNVISGNSTLGISVTGSAELGAANGNVLIGNYIGTQVDGQTTLPTQGPAITLFGAEGTVIGGIGPAGNQIAGSQGSDGYGIEIRANGALGLNNQVLGNTIRGNAAGGIRIEAPDAVIGTAAAPNTIMENSGDGIRLSSATEASIRHNFIGTNADEILGNAGHGVNIAFESTGEVVGNTIVSNNLDGIAVTGSQSLITMSQNSIFGNGDLGIDLGNTGVTENDSGDSDTGPNLLQNFPVLTSATAGSLTVEGTLDTQDTGAYTLEFFASIVPDPSGNGEGRRYLGALSVTPNGVTPFTFTTSEAVSVGDVITATATDPTGRTSEFSDAVVVTDPTASLNFTWTGDGDGTSFDDQNNWADGTNMPGVPGPNDTWTAGPGAGISVDGPWQTDVGSLTGDATVTVGPGGTVSIDVLNQLANTVVEVVSATLRVFDAWNNAGGTVRFQDGAIVEGDGLFDNTAASIWEANGTGNLVTIDVNMTNPVTSTGSGDDDLTLIGYTTVDAGTTLRNNDPSTGAFVVNLDGPTDINANTNLGEGVTVVNNDDLSLNANVRNDDAVSGNLTNGTSGTMTVINNVTVETRFDNEGDLDIMAGNTLNLTGDSNLDGTLTFADFAALDLSNPNATTWAEGDWNGDGAVDISGDFQIFRGDFEDRFTLRPDGQNARITNSSGTTVLLPTVEPVNRGAEINGGNVAPDPNVPDLFIEVLRSSPDFNAADLTFRSGTTDVLGGGVDPTSTITAFNIAADANLRFFDFDINDSFLDIGSPAFEQPGNAIIPENGRINVRDGINVDFRVPLTAKRVGVDNGTLVLGDNSTTNLFAGGTFQGGERQLVAGDNALLNVQGSSSVPSDVDFSTTPNTDTPQDDATLRIGPFGSVRFSDLATDLKTTLDGGTIQPSSAVSYNDLFIYNSGQNLAPAIYQAGVVANGPADFMVEEDATIGGPSTFNTDIGLGADATFTIGDGGSTDLLNFNDIFVAVARATGDQRAVEDRASPKALEAHDRSARRPLARATSDEGGVVVEAGGHLSKTEGGTSIVFVPITNVGAVRVEDGTLIVRNTLDGPGLLGGDGSLDLTNATVTLTGTVSPGDSTGAIGTLNWTGDFAPTASASLDLDLGGLAPGTEHDQLAVAGNVALGGTLRLRHRLGFFPQIGDSFTVLTATGGITGTFAMVEAPNGYTYAVAYNAASVVVTVTARPSFDLQAVSTTPLAVAPGGSVAFDYAIRNNTGSAASGDLFFTASPGGLSGMIRTGTLPGGTTVTGSFVQPVPGTAPAGTYTYTLRVGQFPSVTTDQQPFALTVTVAPLRVPEALRDDEPLGGDTWTVTEANGWGTSPASDIAKAAIETKARTVAALPERFALHAAYPNPFVREATLRYDLPEAAPVRLTAYDLLGRTVAVLADDEMEAGRHTASLDGAGLASGMYLVRLVAADHVFTQRVTLVR